MNDASAQPPSDFAAGGFVGSPPTSGVEDARAASSTRTQDWRESAQARAQQLRQAAEEKARELRGWSEETWEEAKVKAKDLRTDVENYARENPLRAVLYAAGAGFVLGLLFRGR
jgi:ElaB/YqjD/DUF883 family membrane-anchored ribosome-binding protein